MPHTAAVTGIGHCGQVGNEPLRWLRVIVVAQTLGETDKQG
jgi:hypothetical protein